MARSICADHVIDYNKNDFTKNGQRYDLIFAVNGYHLLSASRQALNPEGNYLCAGGVLLQAMLGSLMSKRNGEKMGFIGIAKPNQKDLMDLGELLEDSKVVPVIEKCYPLDEVPRAVRYVAEGHARGKVVIHINFFFLIWLGVVSGPRKKIFRPVSKKERNANDRANLAWLGNLAKRG